VSTSEWSRRTGLTGLAERQTQRRSLSEGGSVVIRVSYVHDLQAVMCVCHGCNSRVTRGRQEALGKLVYLLHYETSKDLKRHEM